MEIQNTFDEALKVAPPARLQQASAKFNARLVARFVTWLGVRGLSASTQEHYGRAARDFARYLRGTSILAATHTEILGYLTWLYENGLSKQSVFVYIEALRALQSTSTWSNALDRSPGQNRCAESSAADRRLPLLRRG